MSTKLMTSVGHASQKRSHDARWVLCEYFYVLGVLRKSSTATAKTKRHPIHLNRTAFFKRRTLISPGKGARENRESYYVGQSLLKKVHRHRAYVCVYTVGLAAITRFCLVGSSCRRWSQGCCMSAACCSLVAMVDRAILVGYRPPS